MTTYNHNCQNCKYEYRQKGCKPLYKQIYIAPVEDPGRDIYVCEKRNKNILEKSKRRFKTAGHDIKLQFCVWLSVTPTDSEEYKIIRLKNCIEAGSECAQLHKAVFEVEYCQKDKLLEVIKDRKKAILKIIKNNNTHVHYYPEEAIK